MREEGPQLRSTQPTRCLSRLSTDGRERINSVELMGYFFVPNSVPTSVTISPLTIGQ